MTQDMRTFLAAHGDALWELPAGLARRHELTALQHALDARGEFPILLARATRDASGAANPIPVVTNLTASRVLTARALGLDDHRKSAEWFARRSAKSVIEYDAEGVRLLRPGKPVVLRWDEVTGLRLDNPGRLAIIGAAGRIRFDLGWKGWQQLADYARAHVSGAPEQ